MSATDQAIDLSASLEDYLETILQLTQSRPVARIKEIAQARGVKPGSVSPAMRRLESLGLIRYGRREYIELTEKGERAARRVYARHKILTSFFEDVLQLPRRAAEDEACAIEHHLSDEAMDRLARFFEFLNSCPGAPADFVQRFQGCARLGDQADEARRRCAFGDCKADDEREAKRTLAELEIGEPAVVTQLRCPAPLRQRLLDMGVLPDVIVRVERHAPGGDPIWITVDNYQLTLRREEARGVLVTVRD